MAKISKLIKGLLPKDLGSLGNLEEAKSVGALVPLDKQEIVPSRREFLKKAGSAVDQTAMPRGALATLVEKGLETVENKTPLSLDVFDLPKFSSALENKKSLMDKVFENFRETKEEYMMDLDEIDAEDKAIDDFINEPIGSGFTEREAEEIDRTLSSVPTGFWDSYEYDEIEGLNEALSDVREFIENPKHEMQEAGTALYEELKGKKLNQNQIEKIINENEKYYISGSGD